MSLNIIQISYCYRRCSDDTDNSDDYTAAVDYIVDSVGSVASYIGSVGFDTGDYIVAVAERTAGCCQTAAGSSAYLVDAVRQVRFAAFVAEKPELFQLQSYVPAYGPSRQNIFACPFQT